MLEEAICAQGPVEVIQEKEVKWALEQMKRGRAVGPTGVLSELLISGRGWPEDIDKKFPGVWMRIWKSWE